MFESLKLIAPRRFSPIRWVAAIFIVVSGLLLLSGVHRPWPSLCLVAGCMLIILDGLLQKDRSSN